MKQISYDNNKIKKQLKKLSKKYMQSGNDFFFSIIKRDKIFYNQFLDCKKASWNCHGSCKRESKQDNINHGAKL